MPKVGGRAPRERRERPLRIQMIAMTPELGRLVRQTEGRIAIFKNEFLGRPMRAEGFANRALRVAWGVLTHDLWVIAEKLREQRKIREQKLRQAA